MWESYGRRISGIAGIASKEESIENFEICLNL